MKAEQHNDAARTAPRPGSPFQVPPLHTASVSLPAMVGHTPSRQTATQQGSPTATASRVRSTPLTSSTPNQKNFTCTPNMKTPSATMTSSTPSPAHPCSRQRHKREGGLQAQRARGTLHVATAGLGGGMPPFPPPPHKAYAYGGRNCE